MLELSVKERTTFKKFFNAGGYIFDFSTASFDAFTYRSVGIKLCDKYRLSKGKSFESFVDEAKTKICIVLISDLLEYYDVKKDMLPADMQKDVDYQHVKEILSNYNYLLDKIENTTIDTHPISIKPYDVFISHASADKLAAVNDIRNELHSLGVKVWYDSEKIAWGDSLSAVIDEGLLNCEFGIIVISRTYFNSKWCNKELKNLVDRNATEDHKVILPLLLNITISEAIDKYPFLEDIKMIEYTKGQEKDIALLFAQVLIQRLKKAVRP